MIVNKVTFAAMAGVGKASVTLSVQRGKLAVTSDGFIDTEDPVNAAYLAKRGHKEPANLAKPAAKKAAAKKDKPVTTNLEALGGVELPDPELPGEEGAAEDKGGGALEKMAIDIRLKRAQARRHELKFEQDKGNLVLVEVVERLASKANAEIKMRLQDLPRRITPRIIAMAKAGATDKEVQQALEREIDDGLDAVRAVLGAPVV